MKKIKTGFTLIELLVVVTIVALLAAMGLSGIMGASEKVKTMNTLATCKSVRDAVLAYYTDCTEMPTDNWRASLFSVPANSWAFQLMRRGKNPPYIDGLDEDDHEVSGQTAVIYDEWGGELKFRVVGLANDKADYHKNAAVFDKAFFVWSPGQDGIDDFGAGDLLYDVYDNDDDGSPGPGWDILPGSWSSFKRLMEPDYFVQNQGGDEPVAGN